MYAEKNEPNTINLVIPSDTDPELIKKLLTELHKRPGGATILPDLATADIINKIISENKPVTNDISDGYHTFGELYEHRITLWIALCRLIAHSPAYQASFPVWRSQLHSDGSKFEGWFMLGLNQERGEQITYHLPMDKWELTWFADTLEKAPCFDGHSAADVLDRINKII